MSLLSKSFLLSLATPVLLSQAWGQTSAGALSLSDSSVARPVSARPVVKPPVAKKPKPIGNEISFGLRLNTDGWSIFADRGYVVSEETKYREMFHDIRLFQVEIGERKHPKETRSTINGDPSRTRPFVYGKLANFYPFKLGYGKRKMIAGKPESGTVSVHWVYAGGLSLGLYKPYYIEALVPNPSIGRYQQETIKYTEETKQPFLTEQLILGASGFAKGLNEVKFIPGVQAKTALHFDFSQRKRTKMALELGANAELYTQRIALMADQKAYPYAFNIYAAVQAGKRW